MSQRVVKVIFALIGLGIIGFLVSFYMAFNGNPIRVYLTRAQVQVYLRETYPQIKFTDVEAHYNFKMSRYGAHAVAHLDTPIRFYIDQDRRGVFKDNLVEQKLTAQARAELSAAAKELIPGLRSSDVWVSWDKEKVEYKLETNYTRELPVEVGLELRWEGDPITKEEFLETATAFHYAMQDKGYNHICSYFFSYRFGENSLVLSYHREEMKMTTQQLLERISHFVEPKRK